MKKVFNIKIILIILTGILISGVSVSAAIKLSSLEVNYDNSQSILTSNDVQNTIDELNVKINEKILEAELLCPENQICTKTWNFDYTGGEQVFTVPKTGTYKFELWGAQGGDHTQGSVGGNGAYTSGKIAFESGMKLYIYTGAKAEGKIGGWNGGGSANDEFDQSRGGGGSTDIRLVNGVWNDFNSLKSRIMVAAGGGGSNYPESENQLLISNGGNAGGLNGIDPNKIGNLAKDYKGTGGSQVNFGKALSIYYTDKNEGTNGVGGFGFGGNGVSGNQSAGGGSGYYGGGGAGYCSPGGGGSSFISGHNGCDAISSSSTSTNIIHTGQSIHYSGYKFIDTKMIDGLGYNWTNVKGSYVGQPQPDGTVTEGHSGNGFARITYYLE